LLSFNYPELKHPERCNKCGACMNSCPIHAILRVDPFEVDITKCATREDCFICAMACPTGALVLKEGRKEELKIREPGGT